MKHHGYVHIPPGPTPEAILERRAADLVLNFARTDPTATDADMGDDLRALAALAIEREPMPWWRKQLIGKDPRHNRGLAGRIYGLFHAEGQVP